VTGDTAGAARTLALGALMIGLTACSSVKDLIGRESSNAIQPTPLAEDFEPTITVTSLWSKRIAKGSDEHYLKLTPIVANDTLFVADRHGHLLATELDTGKVVWEIEDETVQYTGGPGSGDGLVLVGTGDGRVIAREAATGKFRWVAKVSSEVLAAPRAADGVVVVRTGDGRLYGLSADAGKEMWMFERTVPTLTLRGISAPVIDDDIVFAGFDNGRLVAVDLHTGKQLWDSALAVPSGRSDLERMVDVDAEPIVVGTSVYVASFQGGVAALSIVDGQIEWNREISSYEEIAVGDDRVYVTDEESVLWALDQESGASVWKQEALANRFVSGPLYFDGHIVVGDFEGYAHWLDARTGELQFRARIDKARIISPALAAADRVLVYSAAGRLVAMRPQ
jgi:outer membrane protein assembly factor BamB